MLSENSDSLDTMLISLLAGTLPYLSNTSERTRTHYRRMVEYDKDGNTYYIPIILLIGCKYSYLNLNNNVALVAQLGVFLTCNPRLGVRFPSESVIVQIEFLVTVVFDYLRVT